MDRKRLYELVDLVLECTTCERTMDRSRVTFDIDSSGDHTIEVYPHIARPDSEPIFYFCNEEMAKHYDGLEYRVLDPEFRKAEEHIRKVMKEADNGKD